MNAAKLIRPVASVAVTIGLSEMLLVSKQFIHLFHGSTYLYVHVLYFSYLLLFTATAQVTNRWQSPKLVRLISTLVVAFASCVIGIAGVDYQISGRLTEMFASMAIGPFQIGMLLLSGGAEFCAIAVAVAWLEGRFLNPQVHNDRESVVSI